jgi:sodium-dependent dicarboxylate transporter 2/3/5
VEPEPSAPERLSPREQRFEAARRRVGLWLAPAVFGILLLVPMRGLSPEAHRMAAVLAAVFVLWVTEALPMPMSALLGASACVALRIAPAKEVFAPFADPLMFLFVGAFILARGLFVHGLHRRLAFAVLTLRWVDARPGRILLVFGASTAFMSAWISNTATTAMMFTIGMSILAIATADGRGAVDRRYATGLMLMTSFAASIGGLATPVGTPPNLIGLGFIREHAGVEWPFFKWTAIGAPLVLILYVYLFFYMRALCPAGVARIAGGRELLAQERARLGPWTRAQVSTLAAFLLTVALWVAPGVAALALGEKHEVTRWLGDRIPEGVAALVGAALLFVLPGEAGGKALSWRDAVQIDWGVVLLYGGGFAMGVLAFQTGLAEAMARAVTDLLPVRGTTGLLVLSTVAAVLLSEATSNTASANMIVPVVIAVAKAAGVDPLEPALGATMGASLGFMLPVSTPCNAIVYGSGYIPLGRMIRYGLLLDLVGAALVVILVRLLTPILR